MSFHWDCLICPETSATWAEWMPSLIELAGQRPVLFHAHPKAWGELRPVYEAYGLEHTDSFDELLERCWLYLCDNSSTMYEWVALDRPVLTLRGSQYRRGVSHGLRFWDAIPGLEISPADSLPDMIDWYMDAAYTGQKGRHAAEVAYGGLWDGRSLERALAAIEQVVR